MRVGIRETEEARIIRRHFEKKMELSGTKMEKTEGEAGFWGGDQEFIIGSVIKFYMPI